jgi:hypothetical protein
MIERGLVRDKVWTPSSSGRKDPSKKRVNELGELARKEGFRKGREGKDSNLGRGPGELDPVGGVNCVDRVGHVAARQQNLPRNQPISCLLVRSGVASLRSSGDNRVMPFFLVQAGKGTSVVTRFHQPSPSSLPVPFCPFFVD